MIWCRLKLKNGSWHYVHVTKEFAMALCIFQSYEINCGPPPEKNNGAKST
jgi:hypothetical protein